MRMKDEIKEILDFKENADYKRLSVDEITTLENYIIELKQENERLKEERNTLYKYTPEEGFKRIERE